MIAPADGGAKAGVPSRELPDVSLERVRNVGIREGIPVNWLLVTTQVGKRAP